MLWRLDRPETLAVAEEELTRRRTYQPLGKYWAFPLAERLAEWLRPTAVRPNAVTLASAGLMLSAAAIVGCRLLGLGRPRGGRDLAWRWPWCSTRPTGGWPGCRGRARPSADGSTRCSTSWPTWCCTRRSPGPRSAATASRAGCCWASLYASSKYLFQVQSLLGEELEGEMERAAATGESGPRRSRRPVALSGCGKGWSALVRLIGHADVRWHLWIVLALLGRLDLALVAYAVYFALRAVGGALRKGVRYA